MYNRDLKERFISSVTESEHTKRIYEDIFRISSKTEEQLSKDVCAMTAEEGKEIANRLVGLRGTSREKRLYLLRQYVRWCVRENVEGASLDFLKAEPNDFEQIRKKMVSGAADLGEYLDSVFGDAHNDTVRNTYRCYLWLGYMGVREEDAVGITREDVSAKSGTLSVGGAVFRIPDQALYDFMSCANLKQFCFPHPGYNETKYVRRSDGNLLLRGIKSMPTAEYLRKVITRAESDSERRVTYTSAALSGDFRRTFEKERAGIKPDFVPWAEREVAEASSGKDYDPVYIKQRVSNIERAKRLDYERWKFVFT